MKTNTTRQYELKKRRRDAGLVRFECWLTPADKLAVKEFVKNLTGENHERKTDIV